MVKYFKLLIPVLILIILSIVVNAYSTANSTGDTYTQDGAGADINKGAIDALEIEGTNTREVGFIKFDLGQQIATGTLNLFKGNAGSGSSNLSFYYCSNTTWGENTLTYNHGYTTLFNSCNATAFYSVATTSWADTKINLPSQFTNDADGKFTIMASITNPDAAWIYIRANNVSTINYTIPVPPPGVYMNISTGSLATGTYFNYSNSIALNATINSTLVFNCSLYINQTLNTTVTNIAAGTNKQVNFTYVAPDLKRVYNYSISCIGNATTNATTTPAIFFIDSIINTNSLYPANGTQFNYNSININTTLNTTRAANCYLLINNIVNQTAGFSSGNSQTVNFLNTFSKGLTNTSIYCNDSLTSSSRTANNSLFIDTVIPAPTSNLDGNTSYFTGTLLFNVTATDSSSLYSVNISSGNFTNYSIGVLVSPYLSQLSTNIFNRTLGQQTANVTVCDGYYSALTCVTNQYLWDNRAQLNITATNILTGVNATGFTIYRNGTLLGTASTTNYTINDLIAGSYNISIDAPGYALSSAVINIVNTTQSYQFSIYTTNSLYIYIKDESTGAGITDNVTIRFVTGDTQFTNYSNGSSTFFIDNLNVTEYQITFSSTTYLARTYLVTIGNRTQQFLNAWLLPNTSSSTLFTVSDKDTGEALTSVNAGMYRFINTSWYPVESKYTDLTGKVVFTYSPNVNYKFYLTKPGYTDYIFYLNPVLFSTYDIKMSKSTVLNQSVDYDGVTVIYAPTSFSNDNVTTFTWIIGSTAGLLTNYGITLTYPTGGSVTDTGTNAIGGQFIKSLNITGAGYFDTVKLDYYYITTLTGRRNFTILMPITFTAGTSNGTFMVNQNKTYGLGIFERILIITGMVLLIVGIASMVGQPIAGLAIGLCVFFYSYYIGFISIGAIIPSLVIGFLVIIWKSGGY